MISKIQPLLRNQQRLPAPKGLFVTDFDGTLLRTDRTFSQSDLAALERLADLHIVRTIATGRSIHSFLTVGVKHLPVDYVIFSTGAGVAEWPSGRLVRQTSLQGSEVNHICAELLKADLDLMVLRPVPHTHHFAYAAAGPPGADFKRRLDLYSPYAEKLADNGCNFGEATQVLVIVPASMGPATLEKVRSVLPDFSIIHTTSPLDGKSTWIEIFPRGVSKSATAAWLAEELGVSRRDTLSVGNDYNDLDLLDWAAASCVVANAPESLRETYPKVASNDAGGIAEAISRWIDTFRNLGI